MSNTVDKTNTPEEIVYWVNNNNEVIGQIEKSVANADPNYIHREVEIIILNKEDKLLLQQRSKKKKVYPGVWTFTQGHITFGDQPEESAHRELIEELGFDTHLIYAETALVSLPNEKFFVYRFFGMYNEEKIIFEPEEIEAVCFANLTELEALIGDRRFHDWENDDYKTAQRFYQGEFNHVKKILHS